MNLPEAVARTWLKKTPLKMGGTNVPNAAHSPKTTAMPRDNPRNRMVSPNVSPPIPHNNPKRTDQKRVEAGASERTWNKSVVKRSPRIQGAMIQLKKPPTSQ